MNGQQNLNQQMNELREDGSIFENDQVNSRSAGTPVVYSGFTSFRPILYVKL